MKWIAPCLLMLLPMHAGAVPITFEFTAPEFFNRQAEILHDGGSMTLRFTYETDTPDTNPDPVRGSYAALTELSLFVGDREYVGSNFGNVTINSGTPGFPGRETENFSLQADISGFGYEYRFRMYALHLDRPSPGNWLTDALPTEAPAFVPTEIGVILEDINTAGKIVGMAWARTWTQVPEPGTLLLFGGALLGVLAVPRRTLMRRSRELSLGR